MAIAWSAVGGAAAGAAGPPAWWPPPRAGAPRHQAIQFAVRTGHPWRAPNATNGAFDDAAFRAGVASLGFAPDIPRNPRKTGRPKHRGFVPGRWVVERAHAHLSAF